MVPCSAQLSLITFPPSSCSVAVKGLIVVAWNKGIHSSQIMYRSSHAKQTADLTLGPNVKSLWLSSSAHCVFSPPRKIGVEIIWIQSLMLTIQI